MGSSASSQLSVAAPENSNSIPVSLIPSFKVLLLGETGVGKTCLIERYCKGVFPSVVPQNTIGVDFMEKVLNVDGKVVKLLFWDPAGQERCRTAVMKHLYRNVHAVAFVYDVTNLNSLDKLKEWTLECERNGLDLKSIPLILLGNKSDRQLIVPESTARKFAKENTMIWYKTSALQNSELEHLEEIFMSLARILKFSKPLMSPQEQGNIVLALMTEEEEKKKKHCCSWLIALFGY